MGKKFYAMMAVLAFAAGGHGCRAGGKGFLQL